MRQIWLLLSLLSAISLLGQKVVTVSVNESYTFPTSVSIDQAKLISMERAMAKAIADEFGSTVNSLSTLDVTNENGNSSVKHHMTGVSEANGEWIETLGEPTYTVSHNNELLTIGIKVRGVVREFVNSKIDIDLKFLRNAPDDKFESQTFVSGDEMYLHFTTPVDGWVAVYMLDVVSQKVFCLQPNATSNELVARVNAHSDNMFFAQTHNRTTSSSIVLYTTGNQSELEKFYVIFSPNKFNPANSKQKKGSPLANDSRNQYYYPRELDVASFNQWLATNRRSDSQMQVKSTIIEVTPK